MIEEGTYRGLAEGLELEFRVEQQGGSVAVVSGDIVQNGRFLASCLCSSPAVSDGGRTIAGPVVFRGNPELFSGNLRLEADARGVGSFQLSVDMEGGFSDVFAGRLDRQGGFLRRLLIEVDGIEGAQPPASYVTRSGERMDIVTAFRRAGIDVQLAVDPFVGRGTRANRMRGYALAEIHRAMQERSSHPAGSALHTHVFVCSYMAGRDNRGVLGIMYDFDRNDLNRLPREGVAVFYDHPMLSDPRIDAGERAREYVFTVVHEVGHALNLLHSFDKGRPAALSWMNYPQLYPRGPEAERDGTEEFWRRFEEQFDDQERYHLHHGSPREIRAGGFPFGVYEEGVSVPLGGTAEPRRTRLGANPLRQSREVELVLSAVKSGDYFLGEPVLLSVAVRNGSGAPVRVPKALDPAEGFLRLLIRTPAGRVVRYQPPVRLCKTAQMVLVPPDSALPSGTEPVLKYDHIPLFLGAYGPVFTEPGTYYVVAELAGVEGSRHAVSGFAPIRIAAPDAETERLAQQLFDAPAVLRALYLRHPLDAKREWDDFEDALSRAKLSAANTTSSYFHYIAGQGWMSPFSYLDGREAEADPEKAAGRFQKVDPEGLPSSARNRVRRAPGAIVSRGVVVSRPEEYFRAEVPPSGLFGSLGLDVPGRAPAAPINPFERVVKKLTGTATFADVVSWNIENLYRERQKIPAVAELIRSFRCDFWGLEEVSSAALEELVGYINSGGGVSYGSYAVPDGGQQSGCLFRNDTTTFRLLYPDGMPEEVRRIFDVEIMVEKRNGEQTMRSVFFRKPLLAGVRVYQGANRVFDFRCAVVHLKSTDTSLKDTGNALRAAAAQALAQWIEYDRSQNPERDYLIMGDMNAETAQQGLEPFTATEGLKLLSVGMQEEYGKNQALTRVASRRLLDHIVITDDARDNMPAADKAEQIIVRSDTKLADFTTAYSDHVPVAVRFVLGSDQD